MSRKSQITTTELASLAGKTPKTIQNWAKKGKIAYEVDEGGKFLFDLAEIARSLPSVDLSSVISESGSENDAKNRKISDTKRETSEAKALDVENQFLREKIEDLGTQITDLKDEKQEAKTERAAFMREIEKQNERLERKDERIAGLLAAPQEAKTPAKSGFWGWIIFGVLAVVAVVAAITAQQFEFLTF